MAIYKSDIVDVNLESGIIHRSFLLHAIGHKDDDADRFGVRVFRNGEAVNLSGVACQAIFMAPDGSNIALTSYGTVSGNTAYVTLPQACYNVEGQFCLAIKLVGGGVTSTVRIVDGIVDRTGATGTVAPTGSVPTYQEIIAQYEDMVAATEAAESAADSVIGIIGYMFDTTKDYIEGSYVIYDEKLYRFKKSHAAGAWNASQVDQVKVVDALLTDDDAIRVSLNSENLFDGTDVTFKNIKNTSGGISVTNDLFQTGFIPVTPGEKYTATYTEGFVLWYDSEKESIGYSASADFSAAKFVSAPSGAAYGKFIGQVENIRNFQVRKASNGAPLSKALHDTLVGSEKMDCMTPVNLFDIGANNMIGKYISYDDEETIVTNPDFSMTDYVPVTEKHMYCDNAPGFFLLWYNAEKERISATGSGDVQTKNGEAHFTAPSGAVYGRFIFKTDIIHSFYIHDITDSCSYKLNPGKACFLKEKNLFRQTSGTLYGRYYNTTNTLVVNAAFGQTDLIPVANGEWYTSQNTSTFVLWYNIGKAFIGYTESSDYSRDKKVTPPSGAVYARFLFFMVDLDQFFVSCMSSPQYEIDEAYLPASSEANGYQVDQFSGKNWVSFGDSITFQNKWQPIIGTLLKLNMTNCGIGSTSLSGPNVNGREDLPSFWKASRLSAVTAANPDVITILGGANDVTHAGLTIGDDAEFNRAMPADPEASESAEAYSTSASYAVGTYCKNGGILYECTTAISGGEAWTPAHWKAVKNVDTFLGAYSYIIESLLTWKRTVSIVILGTAYGASDGAGHECGITYSQLSEAGRKAAQYYGLPFVDLHGLAGFNKFTMGTGSNAVYSDDTLHPNEEGAKNISRLVFGTFINQVTIH